VHQVGRQCQAGEHRRRFKSLSCSRSHSFWVDSCIFLGNYVTWSRANGGDWPFWWVRLRWIGTTSHSLHRSSKVTQVTSLLQDVTENTCDPLPLSKKSDIEVAACPAGNVVSAAAAAAFALEN